jgi:hypothetical protein
MEKTQMTSGINVWLSKGRGLVLVEAFGEERNQAPAHHHKLTVTGVAVVADDWLAGCRRTTRGQKTLLPPRPVLRIWIGFTQSSISILFAIKEQNLDR